MDEYSRVQIVGQDNQFVHPSKDNGDSGTEEMSRNNSLIGEF